MALRPHLFRSVWRSLLVSATEPTDEGSGRFRWMSLAYLTEINGRSRPHLRETSSEQGPGPFQALSKCLRSYATDDSGFGWPETLDSDEQQDLTEGNRYAGERGLYPPFQLAADRVIEWRVRGPAGHNPIESAVRSSIALDRQ